MSHKTPHQEQQPTSISLEKLEHASLIIELGAALEAAASVGGSYGGKTAL